MRQFLIILLLTPFLVFSQQKPKAPVAAKKPATSTAMKKPATAAAKNPGTTTAAKPGTAVAKKPNPQVVKLTEQAYAFYRDSKDAECEKVIKQILALDPKNRDAHLLRANIAMFNNNFEEMWKNLDKMYKFYPSEPEVYAKFAVTHLNYMFLSDSIKRVLCRKSIKIASRNADGYANLGMVAMAGGYYQDAINCFDISYNKTWKDTMNRVYLNLFYARCLYGVGDTIGAITRLNEIIPRITGNDKYTSIFLRSKYKLDLKQTDVQVDLDTLNAYAPDQPDVWILNAKYFNLTGRSDSACLLAKKVRLSEGGEAFDLSEFCKDMGKTLDLLKYRKLTYSMGDADFVVNLSQFNYSGGIQFNWERGKSFNPSAVEKGKITINTKSLDSAYLQTLEFNADADAGLEDKNSTLWLSKAQYKVLKENSTCKLGFGAGPLNVYRIIGHEQVEVFDGANKEVLIDCVVMTDGVNKICYLDDAGNPLIVKIESETFNLILTKFQ
jgi:tetratricopeptide (TPR) repeat protein